MANHEVTDESARKRRKVSKQITQLLDQSACTFDESFSILGYVHAAVEAAYREEMAKEYGADNKEMIESGVELYRSVYFIMVDKALHYFRPDLFEKSEE